MTPFDGIPIEVDRWLIGSKRAFRIGTGPIIVSPAMWDLIRNAEGDELETLLRNIYVVQLPSFPSFRDMTMVTLGE